MNDEYISGSLIDRIKTAVSVQEIAAEHRKLERTGSHIRCCSPFRQEKSPSFYIYDDGSWWDYGPQEGGDVIDLVQRIESCDLPEALSRLAQRAGIARDLESARLSPEVQDMVDDLIERRWVFKLQTRIAHHYHKQLPSDVREHLNKHYGLTDQTIDRLKIGWSDGSTVDTMIERGETVVRMLATGLLIRTRHGRIFEQHEHRITLPYWSCGQVVYMISRRFEGRTPDDDWQKPKYKKSLVFNERKHHYVSRYVNNSVLWGEDCLRGPVEQVIVTEGITDAMAAWQRGLNVISPVTTRIREKDIDRIIQRTEKAKLIVIINDSEEPRIDERTGKATEPGREGALLTAKMLHQAGRNVRIGELPRPEGSEKVDLNSYLVSHDRATLQSEVIDKARPLTDIMMDEIQENISPVLAKEQLQAIYELIAACEPTVRDMYIHQLWRKLGIPKRTIARSVKDAQAQQLQTVVDEMPPIPPPPKDPSDSSESQGQPEDRDPSPASQLNAPSIKGALSRSDDGYYFRQTKNGTQRLSNFILKPTYLAKVGNRTHICCNIVSISGERFENVLMPEDAFSSSMELARNVLRVYPLLTWSGTTPNVNGVIEDLRMYTIPTLKGSNTLGYALNEAGEPRWVTPKSIIGPKGPMTNPDMVYVPLVCPPPVATQLDISGASLDDEQIRQEIRRLWPLLHQLNEPDVILGLTSWFAASMVAPFIRKRLGHMPILSVSGTQGSGKTSIISDVMWPMFHGVRSAPGSCSDTMFALTVMLSGTSSIAATLDEFKLDLPRHVLDQTCRMMRRAYVGDIERRGRKDRTFDQYPLISPVVVMGEMPQQDPALKERIIPVIPSKSSITPQRIAAMNKLLRMEPSKLSGGLIKLILRLDPDKHMKRATEDLRTRVATDELPPRVKDSLLVVCFGDSICREILDWSGLSKGIRPPLDTYLGSLTDQILELGQDIDILDEVELEPDEAQPIMDPERKVIKYTRSPKDAVDMLMVELETYAHMSLLIEGTHYAYVKDLLYIHLPSCHKVYLEERRRTNEPILTNGLAALYRIIKEKTRCNRCYIRNRIGRIRLGNGKPRCLIIDPTQMRKQIGVQLPCISDRIGPNVRLAHPANE